jgi:hypothetical protein
MADGEDLIHFEVNGDNEAASPEEAQRISRKPVKSTGLVFTAKLKKTIVAVLTITLIGCSLSFSGVLFPGHGADSVEPVNVFDTEPKGAQENIGNVIPTSLWVNFYGLENSLEGEMLPTGTLIAVYDPQGILCGKYEVKIPGRYGVMPVYGDDPVTDIDEGADPGDWLEFKVWGRAAKTEGPDHPMWTGMGDLKQVNLTASIQ